MKVYHLTTPDNPYSPISEYDHWRSYDIKRGYFTAEYIDRVAFVGDDDSYPNQILQRNIAIRDIAQRDALGRNYEIVIENV